MRPSRSRSKYSSSLPGSDARPSVTWTPRTSMGSVAGPLAGAAASVARSVYVACRLVRADEPSPHAERREARRAPPRPQHSASGASFALTWPDVREIARSGRWVGTASTPRRGPYRRALVESPRGPLRPEHPPPRRRGPDRHRAVRARADAAVEPRRARRPLLPGLPELPLSLHRRQGAAGGSDRARRGRRRRGVHPPSRRVRARLHARARHAAGRPRRAARRQELARQTGLLIHSTAGSSIPAGTGT